MNNLLKHKNHPNIIFYNYDNVDTILECISKKKREKIIEEIIYYKNDDYFLFDIDYIKNKQFESFKNIIKDITNKYNIFLKKYYIIIKNIETKKRIQSFLFSFTERNSNKFIYLIENINKISIKIKSICININCKNKFKRCDKNLQMISSHYLNNILNKKLVIKNIKELSYILCCLNIPYNILLQHFVFCIIDIFEITYKKKYECIKFITELEYKHCSSFNKCIYYEYLLINIYNIIFIT
jgi:hypothetical protein